MKLTGKSLEQLKNWYWINHSDNRYHNWEEFDHFSTDSMKYGVLVDFFDSVGIRIFIQPDYKWDNERFWISVYCIKRKDKYLVYNIETRQHARAKAIEKANEILNKR